MPLLQRINGLVAELDNMVKLVEKCNIPVPMEVVNLIDDGKNPDEFTKDIINNCIGKNQITKGKTDALKNLRKHLLEELEVNIPDKVETFRDSRAASAAEMKRLAQTNKKRQKSNTHLLIDLTISTPASISFQSPSVPSPMFLLDDFNDSIWSIVIGFFNAIWSTVNSFCDCNNFG